MTDPVSPSPAPLRFLIVEDELLLAMDMELMIRDAGHCVVAEASCLSEVEDFKVSLEPQVAFVDLQLAEGSSGLDVCSYIRQHWAKAIVIFLTANPKKLPADLAGGHGVVSKPYSRNGLMSVVRYLTEGILDPPPTSPPPTALMAAPELLRQWVT